MVRSARSTSASTLASGHSAHSESPGSARRLLLVGDAAQAETLLTHVVGTSQGTWTLNSCADWFDAIVKLNREEYDAVVAPLRPVERRPEAAVMRLRDAAGTARLILLAEPSNELLARRLLARGCDDYVIWPATSAELFSVLISDSPAARVPPPAPPSPSPSPAHSPTYRNGSAPSDKTIPPPCTPPPVSPPAHIEVDISHVAPPSPHTAAPRARTATDLSGVPLPTLKFDLDAGIISQVIVEALVRHPGSAVKATLDELNARLPGSVRLSVAPVNRPDPALSPNSKLLSRVIPQVGHAPLTDLSPASLTSTPASTGQVLHVLFDRRYGDSSALDLLDLLIPHLSRAIELQSRHQRIQRLAITDDLTGLHNARYFKHILEKVLLKAREQRFPVTLLMFDIDHFKKYNDRFGHPAGDEILIQVARLMKECVREHDFVARLGGDEFAVIFWENDAKRQPYPPHVVQPSRVGKPPSSPELIFERFRKLIQSHKFACLGPEAQGELTISGGLAVYPYDATTPEELIAKADKALMFGAKRGGRNTLHIVGPENQSHPE